MPFGLFLGPYLISRFQRWKEARASVAGLLHFKQISQTTMVIKRLGPYALRLLNGRHLILVFRLSPVHIELEMRGMENIHDTANYIA